MTHPWRIAFLLLLLINVIVLAWSRGYLGLRDTGGEPQRLAGQLHPGRLRVTLPGADLTACRALFGLKSTEIQKALVDWKTQVPDAQLETRALNQPARFDVTLSGFENKAAADARVAELKALGITADVRGAAGSLSILIASLPSEADASVRQRELKDKGITTARIVTVPASSETAIEVHGSAAQIARIMTLAAGMGRSGECGSK
ncbi:MAG: SPOR domain-containing protein [Proteobacteria bacterium]|nr:SPOR domain-containing protein [Pseudomonadota bacterium]HQR03922.1 SPOR domain-containing protein [Rhodocyclaceae bacterium]